MNNNKILESQTYLYRFNQILERMAYKMLSQTLTNSITINFIKCMIPHHQAAIYMSENLLDYTEYKPLKSIAKNIIRMQTIGIEQMKEIARTTVGYINTKTDVINYNEEYLNITNYMIERMKDSLRCINIDLDFVSEMIPHHEGAISMCENLLQYRIDPRLKIVANTIIKEQSNGVKELKQVRKNLCSNK